MRALAVIYVALTAACVVAVLIFLQIGQLVLSRDLPTLMFADLDPISKLATLLLLALLVSAFVNAVRTHDTNAAANLRWLAILSPLPGIFAGAIQAIVIASIAQRLDAPLEVVAPSAVSTIAIVAYGFAVGAVAAVLHQHVRARSSADVFA